jgi:hypothetical protein
VYNVRPAGWGGRLSEASHHRRHRPPGRLAGAAEPLHHDAFVTSYSVMGQQVCWLARYTHAHRTLTDSEHWSYVSLWTLKRRGSASLLHRQPGRSTFYSLNKACDPLAEPHANKAVWEQARRPLSQMSARPLTRGRIGDCRGPDGDRFRRRVGVRGGHTRRYPDEHVVLGRGAQGLQLRQQRLVAHLQGCPR